jgi:ribonucleoside-diphosphate reductase beta chain
MFDLCTPDNQKEALLELAETNEIIRDKNYFAEPYIDALHEVYSNNANAYTKAKAYARALFAFGVVVEGAFFYTGFAQILCLKVLSLLKGCHEQVELIIRDESLHRNMSINALLSHIQENPDIWHVEFHEELYNIAKHGVAIEDAYIEQSVANDIIGFNPLLAKNYVREAINNQLSKLGLAKVFDVAIPNALPWLNEVVFINKEKNFFETRVTEYQSGSSLNWDDDTPMVCPLKNDDGECESCQ